MATKRYIIRLSEAIGSYFEERAKLIGMPVSSVMSMALAEYLENKKGMETIQGLVEAYKEQQNAGK